MNEPRKQSGHMLLITYAISRERKSMEKVFAWGRCACMCKQYLCMSDLIG